jgi:hypothetical protein
MGQRAQREIEHDPAVIDHLLELRCGFVALAQEQVSLAAQIGGVECA